MHKNEKETQKMYKAILLILITIAYSSAEKLTAARAVEIALANNFNIRIAKNDAVKADNTRKLKVGALLPSATADGSAVYSNTEYSSSSTSSFGSGGASSDGWSYSAGASMSWTLFDGFRMFHAYNQVEQAAQLSEQVSRQTIESSAVNVLVAYYNLASARSLLDFAQSQLALSRTALKRTKAMYDYGRATKRDMLAQEVLVNADSSAVAARQLDAIRARHNLNVALGRRPDESVEIIADTSAQAPENDAKFWFEKAAKHNAGLRMAEIQQNIASSQLGIARAAFWPVLAARGSYTQTWSDNDYSRTSAGLYLTWPIFSNLTRITNVQNAQLDEKNAEYSYEQKERELQAHVYQQWETLNNAYQQIGFEQKAIARAEQALAMSEEEYRLGRISDVQYRDAQLALLNARIRLESAMFQSKVAALQLEQLAGLLKVD
jgi:outer membrane protein TolC